MLEHIFRNINDIRVFDMMSNFLGKEEDDVCDIDDIMDILEYPGYKRIEVEDSVKHLVENEILGVKKIEIEGTTGCKTCKWTDKLRLPRMGKHTSHKPENVSKVGIDKYYMKDNNLTQLLRAAVLQQVTIMLEKEDKLPRFEEAIK